MKADKEVSLGEIIEGILQHQKLTDENFEVVKKALMGFRGHILDIMERISKLEAERVIK